MWVVDWGYARRPYKSVLPIVDTLEVTSHLQPLLSNYIRN